MSIFSRKKPKVENALTTTKPFFMGGATAGVFVNEDTAMRTSAVYACVRVISEAVASLPLNVYRRDGDARMLAPEHPLYHILHNEPNPEMTSFVFRETLMNHLLIYGNAYAQIVRDNSWCVKGLYPLLPDRIDVHRSESGEIYYTYWRNEDDKRKGDETGSVVLPKEHVLHIPALGFNGLVGYSPIAMARNAIGLAIATEDYGAGFFANSANPSGILEHAKNLNNHETIKRTWDSLYRGSSKAHGIAVLEEGLTFKTVSIPPDQAQFLETRKFQLNEIARIFRVPPHMIADLEKSSFNNIEQMSLEFLLYTLDPWVSRLESSFYQSLLSPSEKQEYFIKFNIDGLLRGNYEARMKGYAVGRQNGWLSANDIRKLENMNALPAERGGDKYLINGNMTELEDAGLFAKVRMANVILNEYNSLQNAGKNTGAGDSGGSSVINSSGGASPVDNAPGDAPIDPNAIMTALARRVMNSFDSITRGDDT